MSTSVLPNVSLRQPATASIPTTSHQECTWVGHCLGTTCSSDNDCDNDWICANEVCSPRRTTAIHTETSSASTSTPKNALRTGTAIGIGICIVVALAMATMGIAFRVWHLRRRKQAVWAAPTTSSIRPRIETPESPAEDQKHITHNYPRGELPCPSKPIELSSVEFVELEGDHTRTNELRKAPIVVPEHSVLRQQYRFEEYVVSPGARTQGPVTLSPVSNIFPSTLVVGPDHGQHQTHDAERDTMFIDGDGQDSTYILFRWPDTTYSSFSNSSR